LINGNNDTSTSKRDGKPIREPMESVGSDILSRRDDCAFGWSIHIDFPPTDTALSCHALFAKLTRSYLLAALEANFKQSTRENDP
jgi:hypothetical protein